MQVSVKVSGIFNCSLERAFKAPILGDATKFLNGYFLQPPIVQFNEDKTWGQINGIRYPVTKGNLFLPSGILFTDKILDRTENKYWKWTLFDFKPFSLFFLDKAIGEWLVNEDKVNQIQVRYTYTFISSGRFKFLLTWMFCKIQIRGMMRKAIIGIKEQAESKDHFIYD